jgi:hypothetical protein
MRVRTSAARPGGAHADEQPEELVRSTLEVEVEVEAGKVDSNVVQRASLGMEDWPTCLQKRAQVRMLAVLATDDVKSEGGETRSTTGTTCRTGACS